MGASPPRDAPSPAPNDDPWAEGVEQAIVGKPVLFPFNVTVLLIGHNLYC